jgi:hypothetical protein
MNWIRIVVAGLVAGFVMNVADFVMHGLIMGDTYMRYPVFTQEAANPLHFLLISVLIGLAAALLYAKTVGSWSGGWKGGLMFGFFLGLFGFFQHFYDALVYEGFPYFLSWCWGGMGMIDALIGGALIGAIYKAE